MGPPVSSSPFAQMPDAIYAISSDLTGEAYTLTTALWDVLERRFGLRAARAAKHPHLTYVVGECAKPEALAGQLDELADRMPTRHVEIDGLGVFQGEHPVVYLKVTNREQLAPVQCSLAQLARDAGMQIWPYYAQNVWVPHVTLALQDLHPERLNAVLEELKARPIRLVSPLASVELVEVVMPEHVYYKRFHMAGCAGSESSAARTKR